MNIKDIYEDIAFDVDWFYRHKIKYPILNRLFPQQRWIKKRLPWNDWCDKDVLMEEFLSACVIEYQENEADTINWESDEPHQKWKCQFDEAYEWFKNGKPRLQEKIKEAWEKVPFIPFDEYDSIKFPTDIDYSEVDQLEKLLEETDTKYMKWVIENRAYMWS